MNNLKDIHNGGDFIEYGVDVVLSGCQWTIWRIYTTTISLSFTCRGLFYQDVNEQFEGYTQPLGVAQRSHNGCFIRISMNNLKDIHNGCCFCLGKCRVVLSGFQWTIWRIYTTISIWVAIGSALFYQDDNEQFCCKSTKKTLNLQIYWKIFWYFRKK